MAVDPSDPVVRHVLAHARRDVRECRVQLRVELVDHELQDDGRLRSRTFPPGTIVSLPIARAEELVRLGKAARVPDES